MKVVKTETVAFAPINLTLSFDNRDNVVALVAAARKLPWTALTDGRVHEELACLISDLVDLVGNALDSECYRRNHYENGDVHAESREYAIYRPGTNDE